MSAAPPEVPVTRVREVTSELVDAVGRLVSQLSSSSAPPTADELRALVDSSASQLLVATDSDGAVVGMLTLAVFRIPTGLRAWIEDVVVDASARGQGIGRLLTLEAVERARRAGARTVELTSRPSREAANALYRSLGFVTRETNVYRITTDADAD